MERGGQPTSAPCFEKDHEQAGATAEAGEVGSTAARGGDGTLVAGENAGGELQEGTRVSGNAERRLAE